MKPIVAFSLFGWTGIFAGAEGLRAADLQNLIDRSPFSPPGQAVDENAAAPAETLEFRGVVTDETGTAYSLFDTSTNKGRWVRAGDATSSVRVTGFDAANNLLDIEQNGRALRLAMKRATIQAGQAVAAMATAQVNTAPAISGVSGRRAVSADRERLKAVAEAVDARRKARQAAAAKARAATQPAGAPVQPGS